MPRESLSLQVPQVGADLHQVDGDSGHTVRLQPGNSPEDIADERSLARSQLYKLELCWTPHFHPLIDNPDSDGLSEHLAK